MIVGFTGTRQEITAEQTDEILDFVISRSPHRFLHGGAIGSDQLLHEMILHQPASIATAIEIYPASQQRHRYWEGQKHIAFYSGRDCIVHPPIPPLTRNRIIAERCDWLLACPATSEEELRSGTWTTVRYARHAKKPISIVCPNGSVKREGGP